MNQIEIYMQLWSQYAHVPLGLKEFGNYINFLKILTYIICVLRSVDGSHAGSGNLEILVNGGHVTSHVRNLGQQRFVASFVPHSSILHTIDMTFNGEKVPGKYPNVRLHQAVHVQSMATICQESKVGQVNLHSIFTNNDVIKAHRIITAFLSYSARQESMASEVQLILTIC